MLITLDLEGTLIDGELFPELGRKLGYGRDLEYITDAAISGDLPYEEAFELRTSIITGESTRRIREVADTIPLVPGAKETIRILRGMDLTPVIVTGGFDIFALRAETELGVDHVYCNHLDEEDGRVTGVKLPVITPNAKADILRNLAGKQGTPRNLCIAVGDGANDIPMLRAAGLGIAFNATKRVREAANVSVEERNIGAIISFIKRHLEENA